MDKSFPETEYNFSIVIDGVIIKKDLIFSVNILPEYIKEIKCCKHKNSKVLVLAKIESYDSYMNYLIVESLKFYLLRLFSVFGSDISVEKPKTDLQISNPFYEMHVKRPSEKIDETEIGKFIKSSADLLLLDQDYDSILFNITQAQDIDLDDISRFRALFSVFDAIAPKYEKGIDYKNKKMRKDFIQIINEHYKSFNFPRYHDMLQTLIKADLKYENSNKNYSLELKLYFNKLKRIDIKREIIDLDLAFNILKCIQIVRNKVNHGNFNNVSQKLVRTSHELLLPLVQKMLRDELIKKAATLSGR